MCVEWVHKRRKTTMGWCLDPLLTYSKVPSVGTDSVRERVNQWSTSGQPIIRYLLGYLLGNRKSRYLIVPTGRNVGNRNGG